MRPILYLLLLTLFFLQPYTTMGQVENREPFPFKIENSTEFPDDEVYVAILGEDFSGDFEAGIPHKHIWVDLKTGEQKLMERSLNTVPGPVYVMVYDDPANPDSYSVIPARNETEGNRNPDGTAMYADIFTKLSEIPNQTVMLDVIQGCRVYISAGEQLYMFFHGPGPADPKGYTAPSSTDPTDPNRGILHEVIELTYDQWGYFANTTRVDSYKRPVGMEVWGNDTTFINPDLPRPELTDPSNIAEIGVYKKVGEKRIHQYIVNEWLEYVQSYPAFEGCYDPETGEITQPTKTEAFADGTVGTMPNPGPHVDYMQPYIDAIWEKYRNEDLHFYTGDAGYFKGRVQGDVLTVTSQSEAGGPFYGRSGVVNGKPDTQMVLEGKGLMDYVVNDRTVDLMIQAQLTAAITRHVVDVTTPNVGIQYWNDPSQYYQEQPANMYAAFWHREDISVDGRSYGFAYDDVWDQSSSAPVHHPGQVIISFGGYPSPVNADAGPDTDVMYPSQTTAELDGTGSFSNDGNPITYSWEQVGSSAGATISNAQTATPTVSFNSTGIYTFALTVSDGTSDAIDEVTISVLDENLSAPLVDAGADQSAAILQTEVVLNGTATDLDGTIESYAWSQISGPGQATLSGASTANLVVSNLQAGQYTFKLTATDNDNLTGEDQVIVNITGPGACTGGPDNGDYTYEVSGDETDPTITFIPSETGIGNPTCIIFINGAGYNVTPNEPHQISATSGDVVSFYYTYSVPEGGERNTSTNPHSVIVGSCGSSNMFPEVDAGNDVSIVLPATSSATLNGWGEDPEDGSNISFAWSQISGPGTAVLNGANSAQLTASSLEVGIYKFELTVTDSEGQNSTDIAYVFVDLLNTTEKPDAELVISVFPNPMINHLTIQLPPDHGFETISLFAPNGLSMYSNSIADNNIKINTSFLPRGLYIIRLVGENKSKTIKVAKQ
jgi:hypothetical protein